MLTVSRRLDSEAAIQETRVVLANAARDLRAMVLTLENLSHDLESEALDQAVTLLEGLLDESLGIHARIDADLLIKCKKPWNHPVQAIAGPRAPYGRVANECQERLAHAREEELETLRAVHERMKKAHQTSKNARRRRMRRAGWLDEEGAEA